MYPSEKPGQTPCTGLEGGKGLTCAWGSGVWGPSSCALLIPGHPHGQHRKGQVTRKERDASTHAKDGFYWGLVVGEQLY